MTKISIIRYLSVGLVIGGLITATNFNFAAVIDKLSKPVHEAHMLRLEFRWQYEVLRLVGHIATVNHKKNLLSVAASSFPGNSTEIDFILFNAAPSHWEELSMKVLYLLAESSFSEAVLSNNEIIIRGVTTKEVMWKKKLNALQKVLPEGISINANMFYISPTINTKKTCIMAIKAFAVGAINFEESSTKFLDSAHSQLNRIIALANVCKMMTISITGHTDSSGSNKWNQELSLKRATTVSDYIAQGGIKRERLFIYSAGSSYPIANNATSYGRSLNRRIDIKFQTKN